MAGRGGCGAVLLHERDDERFAMLLERVQPSTLADVGDGDEMVGSPGGSANSSGIAVIPAPYAPASQPASRPAGPG
jgi:hypothetical protein